jgi:hypothetical protein
MRTGICSVLLGIAATILFGALAGTVSAQEPGTQLLTHEELKQLLSKTMVAQFSTGRTKGTVVLAQDGTARVDGGTWQARGTWRIEGNRYCSKYPGIRRGYETCYAVQNTGGSTYKLYSTDGDISSWVIEK